MQWMLWMMLVVFTAVAPSKTARPSTHTHILVNTETSSSSVCAPSVATGLQQKLTWRHTTMRNINPKNGILKFQGGRSRGASSSGGVNVHRCLRTSYIGSTSSFDSNAMSVKSYNSGSLVEVVQEPPKAAGMHQNILPTFPPSFAPTNRGSLDLFNPLVGPESHSSEASAIDLFQMPAESLAKMVDLFKELPSNPVSSGSALPPSVDLFSGQSVTFSNEKSPEQLFPENEGWATFDSLQPLASTSGTENPMPSIIPSSVASSAGIDHVPSLPTNVQWPPFPHYSIQSSDPWHNNLDSNQASGSAAAGQLCDGMIFNHNLPRCFNCLNCGGPSRCGMECSALVANNLGDKQNPAKGVIVRMARKAPKHNCSLSVTVACDLNAVTGLHSLETVGPCDYFRMPFWRVFVGGYSISSLELVVLI